MMSVKEPPLVRERSYRPGRRPKMVLGAHFDPASGAAGSSAPHHIPSAATYDVPSPPNVRKTDVAPCAFTFTPVGFTRICALATHAPFARPAIEIRTSHAERRMSEDSEGEAGAHIPGVSVDGRVERRRE